MLLIAHEVLSLVLPTFFWVYIDNVMVSVIIE